MVKIGMVIGDRYEIQELIGTGGMSDVYKARCNKLNRNVAVKVLKQEFSENREFVTKFRREAEAAANLMHPNIVTVYDVGEDNGISYIVMELVDGYTLKEYIEKKSRLAINECISIAIPIASGIEAAHNKGIIHRDIKPQNVIISKDGKVKVTDFGIAKTTTSNTISSNVMGSVHYTSPEQARGGFSDEKSDIYSLGITLFEMVTGRVPFNGDTTVAIAIKHIQEEMPSPRIYVEDIPVSIEQIILKCTQKSPDRRYQKMSEVIEDLKKAYISPNENFVKIDTYEKNSVTKTNLASLYKNEKLLNAKDMSETIDDDISVSERPRKNGGNLVLPPNVKNSDNIEEENRRPERKNVKENHDKKPVKKTPQKKVEPSNSKKKPAQTPAKKPSTKPARNYEKDDDDDEEGATFEKIKTAIIVAFAVLIGIAFLVIVGKVTGLFGGENSKTKYVSVPNITNYELQKATQTLVNSKINYSIEYEESANIPANRVIGTEPKSGSSVEEGSSVVIIVSKPKDGEGAVVKDVSGMAEAEATAYLTGEGYTVEKVYENNDAYEKGTVIKQSPEGNTSVERGSTIVITICSGEAKEKAKMPDLTGYSEETAKQMVADVGMIVTEVNEEYSDTIDEGKVCGQSYTPGSAVKEGTEVTITLSRGPEPRYYSCNKTVTAPEKYQGGPATIVLTTLDGTELMNFMVQEFPAQIHLANIYGVSRGRITITYTITFQEEVQNPDGSVTVQNATAQDSVSYEVEFE